MESLTAANATCGLDYPEHVFSRNRSTSAPAPTPEPTSATTHPPAGGKGRPTPSRREAEAARKRPLVPADRKAAAKSARAAQKEAREREYQALQTGDDRFLPARDKGPVRRYVRDYVDSRRNLGEYFLPVSIVVVLALMLAGTNATAILIVVLVLYTIVAVTVIDAAILARRLKKKLVAKFGEAKIPRGTILYGVMRAFQIRRARLPKPQVKRGEQPH